MGAVEPEFLLTFAMQVLNPTSDTTGAEDERAAALVLKERMTGISARRRPTA